MLYKLFLNSSGPFYLQTSALGSLELSLVIPVIPVWKGSAFFSWNKTLQVKYLGENIVSSNRLLSSNWPSKSAVKIPVAGTAPPRLLRLWLCETGHCCLFVFLLFFGILNVLPMQKQFTWKIGFRIHKEMEDPELSGSGFSIL